MNLQLSRQEILRYYWTGPPNQHRQNNRLDHRVRIGAAQRELSRSNGERFLAPGYSCVPQADWPHRYSATVFPSGANFFRIRATTCGGLGRSADGVYFV